MSASAGFPPVDVAGMSLDEWFRILDDGTLEVRAGKVELGTGLRTALAQIVAEELDLTVDRVVLVDPTTERTPDEGYTAGSRSIRDSGRLLRGLAAELRVVLLERGAVSMGVPTASCSTRDGEVVGPTGSVPFQLLRIGDGTVGAAATGAVEPKTPFEYHTVGRSVPRSDGPRKVTGGPAFVADVRIPGMLHARMVRPPRMGAHVRRVDADDIPFGVRVVHEGDLIAVVAEREADAVAGAQRLRVTWSDDERLLSQEGLFDRMRQITTDDVVLHESGDTGRALSSAVVRVDATYAWPFHAHASIGPSAAVADATGEPIVVHAAAQGIHQLRRGIAALADVPESQVIIRHGEGPGCYGHNGADDAAADAVVVSMAVGRPVRVQWSRADEHVWARKGPAMLVDVRAAVEPSGRIAALETEVWTPTHGGRADRPERYIAGFLRMGTTEPTDTRYLGGDRNARSAYAVPNERVIMHWMPRPELPSSSLRALGATGNVFASESLMDELAEVAGLDPVEIRLRNLDDPRAREVVECAADAIGWDGALPEGRGRGIAFARYENTGAYVATGVEVELEAGTGRMRVRRVVVAQDCGLIVNPDGVRNQLEGNVVQSLSRSVLEEVRWDSDGIVSRDWESYPIIRFSDVPAVETILVNRPDEPSLGVGEPATATTAPAVANAIRAAGGPRIRQVPLAPGWRLRSAPS